MSSGDFNFNPPRLCKEKENEAIVRKVHSISWRKKGKEI